MTTRIAAGVYVCKGNKLELDSERAAGVFKHLAASWAQREKGFNWIVPPEQTFRPEDFHLFPELLIANMLWNQGFSQRSGRLASDILGNLYVIFIDYPQILDLPNCTDEQIAAFTELIRRVEPFANSRKSQLQRERAFWWRDMWLELRDTHGGDPRNFFYAHMDPTGDTAEQREACIKALIKFKGVEHKVAQLMMGFFQEYHLQYGWKENREFWDWFAKIPVIPVDIHHMRTVVRAGLVKSYDSDHRDKISRPLSDWFVEICLENDINHIDLAQAIFNIGATIHARNSLISDPVQRAMHCVTDCPLHKYCVFTVSNDTVQNQRKATRDKIGVLREELERLEESGLALDRQQEIAAEIEQLIQTDSFLERNRGSMQWDKRVPRDAEAIEHLGSGLIGAHLREEMEFNETFDRESHARTIRRTKYAHLTRLHSAEPPPVVPEQGRLDGLF